MRPREEIGELASVQARGTISQIDDRAGSTRPIPQSPYRFRHNEANVRGGAPHLGEHNEAVFSDWLAWGTDELAPYRDALVTP